MDKFTPSTLSLTNLKRLVNLQVHKVGNHEWIQTDSIRLTEREQRRLQDIISDLLDYPLHLMNEATLLARAIYPLLLLAEQPPIQALAEVNLQARYAKFEIEGIVDVVLAKSLSGFIESPYLVVVEAKRGVEGQNPVIQLYGQLLAAAHLNWDNDGLPQQNMFGCYTIADSWTFVKAVVAEIESEKPTLQVEHSREYTEKTEADTILKILKSIVAEYTGNE
jgi:hypothetical protein